MKICVVEDEEVWRDKIQEIMKNTAWIKIFYFKFICAVMELIL